ncbi:unnamed protein product [Urochloa decumbens]|uniref:F-box domain-containing protein n=1 Tax=Urochloa decumbens TaxID=240449 RepID=A0ABC9BR77_9POAL
MAWTSTSFSIHDGDSTIPWVDEPMLSSDNGGDDTTSSEGEDESMMPVDDEDDEEDQVDDNVVVARYEDEPMLLEEADDAAACILPDLPIRNILSRVPPSSATRFKVVCKSWRSMIAARAHRAAAARSVLVNDGDAPCPVTVVGGVDEAGTGVGPRLALRPCRRAPPRHGYTVQNCCGALACLRSGRRDAELLNPATGESLGLGHFFRHGEPSTWTPAENLPWYCLGRCAGAGGEYYKVVRLDVRVPPTRRPAVTCEVLSLGRESWGNPSSGSFAFTPEWKPVGLWDVSYSPAGRGVHVDGAVYYLALSVVGAIVVSFDLATHQVGEVDLPAAAAAEEACGGGAAASLSELDGRLCLSLVRSSNEDARRHGATGAAATMDVYVLGDDTDGGGGGKAWFQVGRIVLDVAARRAPRPLLRRGGRMLMKRADGSLCYYDMEGAIGNGGAAAAGEEVVYEHKGGPREKQQLSGVTADVFEESPLPLQAILLGGGA